MAEAKNLEEVKEITKEAVKEIKKDKSTAFEKFIKSIGWELKKIGSTGTLFVLDNRRRPTGIEYNPKNDELFAGGSILGGRLIVDVNKAKFELKEGNLIVL